MERNIHSDLQFVQKSFWYRVQVFDQSKSELFAHFVLYEDIVSVSVGPNDSLLNDLRQEFSEYMLYSPPESSVAPTEFWTSHSATWPVLSKSALSILAIPVSSVNVERAFSKLRVINRKERAAMMDKSVKMYTCVYYNQLAV